MVLLVEQNIAMAARVRRIHTRHQVTAWQAWRETLNSSPVEHTGGEHYFDMFIMAINAAVSGLGIALLPRLLIDQELRSGKPVRLGQYVSRGSATLYLPFLNKNVSVHH